MTRLVARPSRSVATACLLALAALAGCEVDGRLDCTLTLQFDGSGRVQNDLATGRPRLPGGVVPEEDPAQLAEQRAVHFLARTEGIAAWTGVEAEPAEDDADRSRVTATGWFEDVRAVGIELPGFEESIRFGLEAEGEERVLRYPDPVSTFIRNAFVEELLGREDGDDEVRTRPASAPEGPGSDPERRSLVALDADAFTTAYHKIHGFAEMSTASWRLNLAVVLPGEVAATDGFTPEGQRRVVIHQGPRDVLAVVEAFLEDARRLRERVAEGELGVEAAEDAWVASMDRAAAGAVRWVRYRPVGEDPDPAFTADLEAAREEWAASPWRPRVEAERQRRDEEEADTEAEPPAPADGEEP